MARKGAGHVRLICPHCAKNVSVQRPRGFQKSMPCPNCRIPIMAEEITAATEEATGEGEAAG